MTADYGDPRLPESFWRKVAIDDATGCWVWTGRLNAGGYGETGRHDRSHRAAYAALVSDPPNWEPGGLELDHLCRVRACVNPAHLELVSHQENLLRGGDNAVRSMAHHALGLRKREYIAIFGASAATARGVLLTATELDLELDLLTNNSQETPHDRG